MVKDFDNPPAILLNKSRRDKISLALANQNAHHITTSDYGPKAVKEKLEGIYHFKCAYCESTVKQVASLQVEHYRTKNAVADGGAHVGYYWLALEWSNLVLGCPACNGQGAKGNKFPVLGTRVFSQNPFSNDSFSRSALYANISPLLDEQPMLLHPEIDNPNLHLKFTEFGIIEGVTNRGISSIETCDLNRDALYKERQKLLNDFLVQCEIVFAAKEKWNLSEEIVDDFVLEELKLLKSKSDNPDEPYTSFIEYVIQNPETCILVRLTNPGNQADFRRAFEQFQQTEL